MRKIKIKDIAKKLNISASTVSLVLNNRPSRISEKTRIKILETAEKMNYTKDKMIYLEDKLNLLTVAIILPDILNIEDMKLVKEIKKALKLTDYDSFILEYDNKEEELFDLMDNVMTKGLEAILLIRPSDEKGVLNTYFDVFSMPVIIFDSNIENENVSNIRLMNKDVDILKVTSIIVKEILNRAKDEKKSKEIIVV